MLLLLVFLLLGCKTTPTVDEDNLIIGAVVKETPVTPDYVMEMKSVAVPAYFSENTIKKISFVPKYLLVEPGTLIAFVNQESSAEPIRIIRRDTHKVVEVHTGEITSEKPLYFKFTRPNTKYQLLCVKTECSASIEVKP